MSLKIMRTNVQNDDFKSLSQMLDIDLCERYSMAEREVTQKLDQAASVLIIYVNDCPVACGAFLPVSLSGDYISSITPTAHAREHIKCAEIKRVYVHKQHRGSTNGSLAKSVMLEIEKWARGDDVGLLILKTGDLQPEALRLYASAGYMKVPLFGKPFDCAVTHCLAKFIE